MTQDEARSIFTLAGFSIERMVELPDGYDRERGQPWWFVKTPFGWIEIGWRKRVIQIDWQETSARLEVTTDDVTKHQSLVHAWTIPDAIRYLTTLRQALGDSPGGTPR